MREFFGELDYGNEIREFQETDWLSNPMGCNMAFTTAVFDSVGGFQTAFKLYGDETDFFQRIKQKDLTILYVPKAEVEQNIPVERLTKKELRYKSYLHGKGFAIPWLLSSPGFIRRFLKIGWYSIKVLGHGVFYLYNPTFYRFFILWFYWGNIVQFIEGLGKKA